MTNGLYPEIEPHHRGTLAVGDGNAMYWEICGNPAGKPVVVLHGGPGSGCSPWHRRLFDPADYRVVLFDQRGCGRSTPHASNPRTGLATNTTVHLLADIELLRERLEIARWMVAGGSWGSTLALAYAESHPERVTGMLLWGVTTGRREEFDWLFRGGVARFFPGPWEQLREAVPPGAEGGELVEVYHRLLNDADPAVRQRAAFEWCMWESATPAWPPVQGLAPRFRDPAFAMAFARIVTHYVSHNAWLEDGSLLRGAASLAGVPGILVNGRFDFQAPIANAWALKRAWPGVELVVVEDVGHAATEPALTAELVGAADRLASRV